MFKIIKNDLDIRPMYHWKGKRVKGHIYVCILAYFIIDLMEMILPNGDIKNKLTVNSKEHDEILNVHNIKKVDVPK